MNIYAIIAVALVVLGLISYQQAEIYRLEKSVAHRNKNNREFESYVKVY